MTTDLFTAAHRLREVVGTRPCAKVFQRLLDISRVLPADTGIHGAGVADTGRSVAGAAGCHSGSGIAGAVDLFTERNLAFGGAARRLGLTAEISRQVGNVLLAQRQDHRRHQVVFAGARLENGQLLGDVARMLAGQLGPDRVGAVAVSTVTGQTGH